MGTSTCTGCFGRDPVTSSSPDRGSGEPDDEVLAGGLDDFVGDGGEVVDVEDAADLGEEAVHEPEVAAGDPSDGGDGFGVGEVVGERVRPSRW